MEDEAYWSGRPVAVTGGAGFIGSHLVDHLVKRGAQVTVVDDLSSGNIGYLVRHINAGVVLFRQGDLRQTRVADAALTGSDTVFHFAAGAENLLLDSQVLGAAARRGVRRFVFASSASVYPAAPPGDAATSLSEEMAGPPYDPDGADGWAKLTGEKTLAALCRDGALQGVSCRYFAVYGPRAGESHGLTAIMSRALNKQSPMRLPGDARQPRSWCFVRDAVRGALLAAEQIGDGSAVNIGAAPTASLLDAAGLIADIAEHEADFELDEEMPNEAAIRCGEFTRATELLGWSAKVALDRGLRRMFEWYRRSRELANRA